MSWAPAPQKRDQMVLFSRRLDDALPADHSVRLLDDILGRLDWAAWEECYHGEIGQPPIHPRVLAGTILYGLLKRIRSSRALEEALLVRIDFQWLVEGRTIDHSTLSKFRQRQAEPLKNLFVNVGLLARELGWLPLETLAYDGTRIKSNNRRGGTRTPDELSQMQAELRKKFAELEAQASQEDARDQEVFGTKNAHALPEELAGTRRRLAQVDAALAELKRVAEAGETVPTRVPLTDPQSRLSPNKEGGFAPNYTPLATVDAASGLIVAVDVSAMTNEEEHLIGQIRGVQRDFQLSAQPAELLGDGAMCTGPNLAGLEALNVTLYSPLPGRVPASLNPAVRADPKQPVPPELWDKLPCQKAGKRGGQQLYQLTKDAFIYDAEQNCYWCPQGRELPAVHKTSEPRSGEQIERTRYKADPTACAECPLRARCLKQGTDEDRTSGRQVTRDQFDGHREDHQKRMETEEAQTKYKRRKEVAERPFATIKHLFGVRQFLLRGLDRVRTEWHWVATAFNLHRLMSLLRTRAGPLGSALLPMPPPT